MNVGHEEAAKYLKNNRIKVVDTTMVLVLGLFAHLHYGYCTVEY
jgi:hypothetical protein